MSKAVTAYYWFAGRRVADRPRQDDPADMGTAFGLELSLLEMPDPSAAAARAPVTPPPGWIHRLAMRRKAAI